MADLRISRFDLILFYSVFKRSTFLNTYQQLTTCPGNPKNRTFFDGNTKILFRSETIDRKQENREPVVAALTSARFYKTDFRSASDKSDRMITDEVVR